VINLATVHHIAKGEAHTILQPRLADTIDHFSHTVSNKLLHIIQTTRESSRLEAITSSLVENDWKNKSRRWPFAFLPLLAADLVGSAGEAAAYLTAGWNLLHLSAHLFDQIEDEGYVSISGETMPLAEAVNLATTLLFLARLALDELPAAGVPLPLACQLGRELNQTITKMCVGQHEDLVSMTEAGASLDRYWQVMAFKSGLFFGWATCAGALLGKGSPAEAEQCKTYGYNLGLLLQILDDWTGLYGDSKESDLAMGKRTLPILYALTVAPPQEKVRLTALLEDASTAKQAECEARDEIIRLGGLHYTLVQATIRYKRAKAALATVNTGRPNPLLELLDIAFPVLLCVQQPA
jgi:geranylgeranyl diphosphate synthase, type I